MPLWLMLLEGIGYFMFGPMSRRSIPLLKRLSKLTTHPSIVPRLLSYMGRCVRFARGDSLVVCGRYSDNGHWLIVPSVVRLNAVNVILR